jgi:hypothetical protein
MEIGKKPYVYPHVKISAEAAQTRLQQAEADMQRAQSLDNSPQDMLAEKGVVRVPEADSYYNRRFQGDLEQGSLMGDFVSVRFEGDRVTVHENPRAYTGREQKIYHLNRANLAECTVQNIISGW